MALEIRQLFLLGVLRGTLAMAAMVAYLQFLEVPLAMVAAVAAALAALVQTQAMEEVPASWAKVRMVQVA